MYSNVGASKVAIFSSVLWFSSLVQFVLLWQKKSKILLVRNPQISCSSLSLKSVFQIKFLHVEIYIQSKDCYSITFMILLWNAMEYICLKLFCFDVMKDLREN